MSFIRKRLSKVWDRGNNENNRDFHGGYRTSMSSASTEYSGTTSSSLLGSIQEVSPGRLHKAASTTFQAFSDTIRAKTQIFYTTQDRSEKANTDASEVKTPRKTGHRPAIWSSSRGRQGLTDHTSQGSVANSLETPTILRTRPVEAAPSLDVDIPSYSFTETSVRDRPTSDSPTKKIENQTVAHGHYAPKQLWPSPTNLVPLPLPMINMPLSSTKHSLLLDDPYTEPPHEVMYDSAMFDSCRSTSGANKHIAQEQEDYASDIECIGDPVKNDGFSPASIASQSYSTPLTAQARRTPISARSLFVKGTQARVQIQQTPSPYQKAKGSQGSPLVSAAIPDTGPGNSLKSPLTVIRSELSMPKFPSEPVQTGARIDQPDSPLAHRSHSYDFFLECHPPEPTTAAAIERSSYIRLPSNVYETSMESAASSPGIPYMGPRHAWDEARADRNDRYLAIRTMSGTTYSDQGSDSELGLSRSPSRKLVRRSGDKNGVSLSQVHQQARLATPERNDTENMVLESRNPSNTSLQKKLEALELLESSCEASTDSEAQSRYSSSPTPMLDFYVEANNRVSGNVLDATDTGCSNSPRGASSGNEQQAESDSGLVSMKSESDRLGLFDSIIGYDTDMEDADQQSLGLSVSTSSVDEGRLSCKHILGVTNTKLDDEEFEDLVLRTQNFHRLTSAHHNGLHKDCEEQRKTLGGREKDAAGKGSGNCEASACALAVETEAFPNAFTLASSQSHGGQLSRILLDTELINDHDILETTAIDGKRTASCDIPEDWERFSPPRTPESADREAFRDGLRLYGLSPQAIEKNLERIYSPPSTPVQYSRSASTESIRTTNSCAVTTSSPLCYVPPPFPTLHVRSSPARRTSSVIAGLEPRGDQSGGESSPKIINGEFNQIQEALTTVVQELTLLENDTAPSEPRSTNICPNAVRSDDPPIADTQAEYALVDLDSLGFPCPSKIRLPDSPLVTAETAPLFAGSLKPRKRKQQTFQPTLIRDSEKEPTIIEIREPSPKKAHFDNETQPLGETTGNRGKKKRKPKKKRMRTTGSVSTGKSLMSSPVNKSLGSVPLDASSPTVLRSTTNREYQTSSNEKGIWWARNKDAANEDQSPLAEKTIKRSMGTESEEASAEDDDIGKGKENMSRNNNESELMDMEV